MGKRVKNLPSLQDLTGLDFYEAKKNLPNFNNLTGFNNGGQITHRDFNYTY
jgi:hypothetical protein